MSLTPIAIFACAVIATALAVVALWRESRSLASWAFAVGMLLLAAETACVGLAVDTIIPLERAAWQRNRLIVASFLPGIWLLFSITYARGNYREFLKKWRFLLAFVGLASIGLAVTFAGSLMVLPPFLETLQQADYLELTLPGKLIIGILLLSSILILMNLERTFTASVGTMRWRIKFMVVGLALLFALRLYSSSQNLVYGHLSLHLNLVNSLAVGLTAILIAVSLFRARLFETELYPSLAMLQGSVIALLAGLYLLFMGAFARIVAVLGGDAEFPLKAFILLVAVAGLGILLLSDRLQQRLRILVSRHFRRPHYDYRKIWSQFTERTTSLNDRTRFCRAVARLISETFNSLSVNVWILDEKSQQLDFAASTLLAEEQAGRALLAHDQTSQLIDGLRKHPHPVDIETTDEPWITDLRKWNPDFFLKGSHRICVPLISGGEVLGVITLADRVSGLRFSLEDLDLLKCIGDQVAASLRNIELSEKILRAREMEAFQTMATFLVHDLKNVAYTLSLMLQNMRQHFNNPDFREDALKGLTRSVDHLNELIRRFNLLRQGLKLNCVESDLNSIVTNTLAGFPTLPGVKLSQNLQNDRQIMADPEQLQKVVTNLIINARDAVGDTGQIKVDTAFRDGWIELAIADNGVGMSADFLKNQLFKPFQSTKKSGLGIGMFHTKTIVEAHQGRITVDSAPGQGTTFRVLLPPKDDHQS